MDGATPRLRRVTIVTSILAAAIVGVALLAANRTGSDGEGWMQDELVSVLGEATYDTEAVDIVRNPYSRSEFLQGSLTTFSNSSASGQDRKSAWRYLAPAGAQSKDTSGTSGSGSAKSSWKDNYNEEAASIIKSAESEIDYSHTPQHAEKPVNSSEHDNLAAEAKGIIAAAITSNAELEKLKPPSPTSNPAPASSDNSDSGWKGKTIEWARDDKDLAADLEKSLNPATDADGPGSTTDEKTVSGVDWKQDVDSPNGAGKGVWKGLGNAGEPNIWADMNISTDADAPTRNDVDFGHSAHSAGSAGGLASTSSLPAFSLGGRVGGGSLGGGQGGNSGSGGSGSGAVGGRSRGGPISNEWSVVNNDHIGRDTPYSPGNASGSQEPPGPPAQVIIGYETKMVHTKHGGTSDCYLRPMDCPLTPVYYTDDEVKIPIYGPKAK